MEEIADFDSWLANYKPPEVVYWAIYDNETGEITGIYPDSAAQEKTYKIKIERELAEDIMNGVIRMNTCFVDPESEEVEIIEKYGLRKIDDIVHRIPDAKYNQIDQPDILLTYDAKLKTLTVIMAEKMRTKKIHWTDETSVNFLITAYNNPYHVLKTFSCKLDDLKQGPISTIIDNNNQRFSVFTRRLFKKYLYREL